MVQFTVPGFEQAGDLLNLLGLLHRVRTDLTGELTVDTGRWYLPDGSGGVFIDAFTELLEHFNGGDYLGGGRCLHGGIKSGRRVKIYDRTPGDVPVAFLGSSQLAWQLLVRPDVPTDR